MESSLKNPDKTIAAFIHISTFSKYFLPFGNFIFPLVLWTAKQQDPFVDHHGKQALNFQISIFLYFIFLVCLGIAGIIFIGVKLDSLDNLIFHNHFHELFQLTQAVPLLIFIGIIGLLLLGLFILEIVAVITATVKASNGEAYNYPFTINFITPTSVENHQSKNEQFNNTQI
ncbi:DUF4870 domain-containing protein [Antarcticibacterium sp. 1MA-6-2]|uniref:DUF4870 domain-containing protein n=1 Tax=Antarcticibacterium sp. 1MA-6-2 TaxID=2908210 RepID=UPI001F3192F0|nr:DUF4870 domain-containing protein [Antarcticibacterium sp. 1MA-6-2]UJH92026.1 DUF4870 domain-containing protein [Antarcticibacterium sp. 1MA-6-2]